MILSYIANALHAGRSHLHPCHVERASQVDGPAPCFDQHGVEAEPSCIHRGIMETKVSGEPGQEDSLQAAIAQIARQTRRRVPIVLEKCRIGIDRLPKTLADNQLCPLRLKLRMKGRPRRAGYNDRATRFCCPYGMLSIGVQILQAE